MKWITSTLMAWSFRRGYWYQPYDSDIDWITWCGGGPLDNDTVR